MTERQGESNPQKRHQRVALAAATVAVGMLGMAYAAVPLYQMFCQVTGFAGTTQRATAAPKQSLDRKITIRFDANTAGGLTWVFQPDAQTMDVRIGAETLAFYRARNTSQTALTGSATFNVAPEAAGRYFNKIECFCFTEQTLQPGETVEMPVSFFVDPEIVKDSDARHISQITLSYTFYPVSEKQAAVKPVQAGKKEGS
ncbi:MAG: cytochrome c oxidase assembly protein [Hyphomicrobiaceae bacterium]